MIDDIRKLNGEGDKNSSDYVDLSEFSVGRKPNPIYRRPIQRRTEQVRREYEEPMTRPRIPEPVREQPIKNYSKKTSGNGGNKIFLIVAIVLILGAVGVSAYNFYLLRGSTWDCFTDRCTEYYPKQEWLDANCQVDGSGIGICRFRYQNQDQSVLRSQLEEFPADHSIFCKSFSCDTQILRRAG